MGSTSSSRPFRTEASLEAELKTRDAVAPFLRRRGFTDVVNHRKVAGTAREQFTSFALKGSHWPGTIGS
jgi:hypothetical protein